MTAFDFAELKDKQVSILIVGKDGRKETYKGSVKDIQGKYLILTADYWGPKHDLEKVVIRTDIIESVWIYNKK